VFKAPSRKYLAPSLSDGATRQDKMSTVMGVKKRRAHTSIYLLIDSLSLCLSVHILLLNFMETFQYNISGKNVSEMTRFVSSGT